VRPPSKPFRLAVETKLPKHVNLRYGHGIDIGPDGNQPERANYAEVILLERLRAAIARLNPTLTNETRAEVLAKVMQAALWVIAHELVESIRKGVSVDWIHREAARARMRVLVKRLLRKYGYPHCHASSPINDIGICRRSRRMSGFAGPQTGAPSRIFFSRRATP
jgi:type I site-specific restriction-modification system R (restriction) subunit